MQLLTFTSQDFNRHPGRIKRNAKESPVVIIDRGQPDIVIMSYEHYASLAPIGRSFLDRIGMSGLSDIDLDTSLPAAPPRD